ncbi:LysR family transcriptional regulator [Aquibium sp. LZ166]|uniref:LysR family transcriptional regulator n=1 Tax=Aquibium pacificus TaxID=3153579 RepID=A0ABV3SEF9_9HYPH
MHNLPMLNWSDLRHLIAVARHGSTLAAAKALGVNQSTVHRRLAVLESALELSLVRREPTGYRLSEIGETLIDQVLAVETSIAVLERQVDALKNDLRGVVRLTCPEPTVPRIAATGLIDRFHQRYSGLAVEFVTSDRYLDIAKGEADVAFRSGEPVDDSLVGRKICDSVWAVYASRAYVARHGRPASVAGLGHHALIGFDGIMKNHRAAKWLAAVVPDARIVSRSTGMLATVSAVKSGVGVAPLPTTLGDAEVDLVQVLPPVAELTRSWYVLTHPDLRKTPRVAAFVDHVLSDIEGLRTALVG